ncbi:MAG TPA: epimerase, partial [Armatimonadota bacterium]|nr:epimerase [Armatimonadota bacterium]
APVGRLEDERVEEITAETYGPLNARCEQAAEQAMPGRVLNIRPGLIVGPYDPTYRFTYWPARVARGGEVLAPDRPDLPVQFIDVRDLAEWIVRQVEAGRTGLYNATGPDRTLTLGEVLDTSRQVSGSDARFTWAGEEFLLEQGVQPWMELPLWIPARQGWPGMTSMDVGKAVGEGLTFRSLGATIRDTLEWDASLPAEVPRPAGLSPEREQAILQAWHARSV